MPFHLVYIKTADMYYMYIVTITEVPGLWMVETVDSCQSAKALSQRWGDRRFAEENTPLHIMLQVNTSGEESKCHPSCVFPARKILPPSPLLMSCALSAHACVFCVLEVGLSH